ncbi:glycosyltransferase family 4 protein [Malikia spinosa]|uniref:Glycosyltransferase family 4 protein n=1 Tax=Malikia spinosa TaxID=86180 RepID=A0A7C9NBU0_9BURK|nr:glycosyltransferase family 4 protein [Malikia spinosa]MYZ53005.1 glycosyltransferase family 4 protein [Malikia spinosa]
MRVLLLTQWFDPEPVPKGLAFARELVRQGCKVEVVTGFPNYPGGKLYSGYRIRPIQREEVDGVRITRVPLYPSHDSSAIRRIANYASFSASLLFYTLFVARKADVIYAYHPPLTVGVAAGLIRLLRRIPVVYDIQDMWPDSLRASGMLGNEKILARVEKVCQWVYRTVDKIVVLSPGFKSLLVSRGVDARKIEVIYNWCDESSIFDTTKDISQKNYLPEGFNILFAGTMGKGQGLTAVLDAAAIVRDSAPKIRFVFLGSGTECEPLKEKARSIGLQNVLFLPRVPMTEVGPLLQAADALLVHLKNDALYHVTIPSKTQAYMAAGKPVLMAVSGDAASLIEKARCGVTAFSEDPLSIAEAAMKLAKLQTSDLVEMGKRGQDHYWKDLSLSTGVSRFKEIFLDITRDR